MAIRDFFNRNSEERERTVQSNGGSFGYQVSQLLGGFFGTSTSGEKVTPKTAMQQSTVFACISAGTKQFAKLPIDVSKKNAESRENVDHNHYLAQILEVQPNPEMTPYMAKAWLAQSVMSWGNAYFEIDYDTQGKPMYVWPLLPGFVNVERDKDGKLFYRYNDGAQAYDLPAEKVWHIPSAITANGIVGLSPIAQCSLGIGSAIAADKFGANFWKNGTHVGSIITMAGEGAKGSDKRAEIQQRMTDSEGIKFAGRNVVLPKGAEFHRIGIPPEDAQYLQTKQFSRVEICSIFGIPPAMIGDMSQGTYSNTEQQMRAFADNFLAPLCVSVEETANLQLVVKQERGVVYVKFNLASVLRSDPMEQAQILAIEKQNGALSLNEWRALKDLAPVVGGDTHFDPMNMIPVDFAAEYWKQQLDAAPPALAPTTNPNTPASTVKSLRSFESRSGEFDEREYRARKKNLRKDHEALFLDGYSRLQRREVNDLRKAAEKFYKTDDGEGFVEWLVEYYAKAPEWMAKALRSTYQTYVTNVARYEADSVKFKDLTDTMLRELTDKTTHYATMNHVITSDRTLRADIASENPLEAINERLDYWDENRAASEVSKELVGSGSAVSKVVWAAAGITAMKWAASANACPICQELDGITVSIEASFLSSEDSIGDFSPDTDRTQPPLHDGCTCEIVPE